MVPVVTSTAVRLPCSPTASASTALMRALTSSTTAYSVSAVPHPTHYVAIIPLCAVQSFDKMQIINAVCFLFFCSISTLNLHLLMQTLGPKT